MLGEPLVVARDYAARWVRPKVDLDELARLHREGWSLRNLARQFGVGRERMTALSQEEGFKVSHQTWVKESLSRIR